MTHFPAVPSLVTLVSIFVLFCFCFITAANLGGTINLLEFVKLESEKRSTVYFP